MSTWFNILLIIYICVIPEKVVKKQSVQLQKRQGPCVKQNRNVGQKQVRRVAKNAAVATKKEEGNIDENMNICWLCSGRCHFRLSKGW